MSRAGILNGKHLSNLRAEAPENAVDLIHAAKKFRVGLTTIKEAIDAGKIAAAVVQVERPRTMNGKAHTRKITCLLVSADDCKREFAKPVTSEPIADDLELIHILADELNDEKEFPGERKVYPLMLRKWCTWDPHPALGEKKIRHDGGVKRAKQVQQQKASRQDIFACVAAWRHPLSFPFLGNKALGEWEAEGVFNHRTKRICYTRAYIEEHFDRFKFPAGILNSPCYRERLEAFAPVWPGKNPGDPWRITVFTKDSVMALIDRRAGKADGGEWIDDECKAWEKDSVVWRSTAGAIEKRDVTKKQVKWLRRWRGLDLTDKPDGEAKAGWLRYRIVPTKKAGPPIAVHHAIDLDAILKDPTIFQSEETNGDGAEAAGQTPTVQSTQRQVAITKGEVTVCGDKKKLLKSQLDCVRALYEAVESSLTLSQLVKKSGRTDAAGILKRLAESDSQWKAAIIFPGVGYAGGYRLR